MHVTQPILVIFLLLSLVTDEIYAFLPSLNSIHQQSITRFNVARYTDLTSDQDTISAYRRRKVAKSVGVFINLLAIGTLGSQLARAEDDKEIIPATSVDNASVDFGSFKVPYFHSNIPVSKVLGEKATVVVNMKLDDPQTAFQFPGLTDLYNQYGKRGLNVLIFPTDQGWFEPDDDETCRLKAKEYYQFGDFPHAVVFDKVDLLGPSAHPLYVAMTSALPTPNGYNRITLNYEKFLLDAQGRPVRRYPRKFSPQDMSQDIEALLNDQPLPEATPSFLQFWREAKREVPKSEYSFRFNYNYYNSPNSMYKYNPLNDAPSLK